MPWKADNAFTVRLWTLHPKYLDAQGLVALWREGLLARAVLRGSTRGYRHHPQLLRFRQHTAPRAAINAYLAAVVAEAQRRGYSFDRRKLGPVRPGIGLTVTRGQLAHEWRHLLRKLKQRSPPLHARWRGRRSPQAHPLFRVVRGGIEAWERTRTSGTPRRRQASCRRPRGFSAGSVRSSGPRRS